MPKTETIKGGNAEVDMDFSPLADMDAMAGAEATQAGPAVDWEKTSKDWQHVAENLAKENEELRIDLNHSQETAKRLAKEVVAATAVANDWKKRADDNEHEARSERRDADKARRKAMFFKGVALALDPVKATAAEAAHLGSPEPEGSLTSRISRMVTDGYQAQRGY